MGESIHIPYKLGSTAPEFELILLTFLSFYFQNWNFARLIRGIELTS